MAITDYYELYIAEQEKRKQLQAENEQLRKDAERYRYIKTLGKLGADEGGLYFAMGMRDKEKLANLLDTYLDKAMAETK